jgi:hypothetical protein
MMVILNDRLEARAIAASFRDKMTALANFTAVRSAFYVH